MIILGSRGREVEVSSGQFHCPKCGASRLYKRKRRANYFTLYFIPLFQIENLGEVIECQTCRQIYKPDILNYKPPSSAERLLLVIRNELDSGTPIHMAERKLVNSGMDEASAREAVNLAAGDAKKTCQACGYLYRETVTRCSNCGSLLVMSVE